MKNISGCMLAIASLLICSNCKKQTAAEPTAPAPDVLVTEACNTQYLQLSVDPSTGNSYLFSVSNSPSNPTVTVTPTNWPSSTPQVMSTGLGPIYQMTGLSYDPTSGNCYGITGNPGPTSDLLITFTTGNPNGATTIPLSSATGAPFNLSDIELNPVNGLYYAINHLTGGSTRLVTVDVNTGLVTDMAPVFSFDATGLAINCNGGSSGFGDIYLMSMNGPNGDVYTANAVTGALTAGPCPYPGVIDPGATSNREMGLHYDCTCTNRLVTGNFAGMAGNILLTDGRPACLGIVGYASIPGISVGLRPTVDFSQW